MYTRRVSKTPKSYILLKFLSTILIIRFAPPFRTMSYTLLPDNDHIPNGSREVFKDIMKPVLNFCYIFGQSFNSKSMLTLFLSKFMLVVVFAFISFVFALGVFNRPEMIDVWVQFSLYVIPLLCFPIGAYIFASSAYHRLMERNTTTSVSVRFYLSNEGSDNNTHPPGHNREWLKHIAVKSIFYPLFLEIIQ